MGLVVVFPSTCDLITSYWLRPYTFDIKAYILSWGRQSHM
jgi:hypothetical protein